MGTDANGKLWWVSWEERDSPEDTRPIHDPPNHAVVAWWETGISGDGACATIVALVHAPDDAAVEKAIDADWPSKNDRVWRFKDIREERPLTIGDRFPLEPWSLARLKELGVEVFGRSFKKG